ncbi:protein kinase family protein [Legionella bononiensis]|uniref:protein kinase family protein n=1 Tax=Legionella bononiensis TaxID=2793102 RepID=UPI0019343A29|nr:protein kinase family protein [Legionella bononiensis]MBL7480603.1 protein kinase family protein [Legionella bononiensis]
MFSRIRPTSKYSSNEPYLIKLDILINKYNENQVNGIVDIISLQQINAVADKLYLMVSTDPPKDYGSDFMKWYNKKEISRELKNLSESSNTKSSKKQRIADISVAVPHHRKDFSRVPSPKEFKKRVKKVSFFSSEPKYFSDIRLLLHQFHELDPNKPDFDWGMALGQLELLQQKIVEILIDDLDLNETPDRILLSRLLMVVNRTMNEFFRMNSELSSRYMLQTPNRVSTIIDPYADDDRHNLRHLVAELISTPKPLEIDEFSLEFLGGNNNKNWKITNRNNHARYTLRIERPEYYFDHDLRHRVKMNPNLSRYLAQEFDFYPTDEIAHRGSESEYNLSITEFCSEGDVLSYRRSINESMSQEEIVTAVIDMSRQILDFALELQRDHLFYMDIKPENFLLRDNGEVFTADLKSILNTQDIQIKTNLIVTTQENAPPEYPTARSYDSDPFMTYQLGVLMYLLMVGPDAEGKRDLLNRLSDEQSLDFSLPVFTVAGGEAMIDLIRAATRPIPSERIPLRHLSEAINLVHNELNQEQHHASDSVVPISSR